MKRLLIYGLIAGFILLFASLNYAQEAVEFKAEIEKQSEDKEVDTGGREVELRTITVQGKKELKPSKTVIDTDDYIPAGDPQSIMEYLKNQAVLDYQGKSDLIPDDDEYTMRGFDSKRFTTAIDGLALRKTGGRQSSHIVDYALLPPWLIEKIEVIPGPHSALYPAKSIGGVLNFITKKPVKKNTLMPSIGASASYKSYYTQNYNANMSGSILSFTYDFGYQAYSTDGYLKNTETDYNTQYGRFGYVFENGAYVTLSASRNIMNRNMAVENYEGMETNSDNAPGSEYDPDYPVTETSQSSGRNVRYEWQDPSWDKEAHSYRGNLSLPTAAGIISGTAYYDKEVRNKRSKEYDSDTGELTRTEGETKWWSQGGKIQDEFKLAENHTTTIAFDTEHMFDGDEKDLRVKIFGYAAQHEWNIIKPLTLIAGVRYEDVTARVSNRGITGEGDWIVRNWDGVMPKSFVKYAMDDIAAFMRDTSISAGVSRIWHAPDYHGIYNPQGRPTGAWLKPEEGVGYDLIFMRRLFNELDLKAGYSFSAIQNYMAYNSSFYKYDTDYIEGMEYKDYMINLHEMYRHGVEIDLSGKIIDPLYVCVSYAFQKYVNQGDEPAGEQEASDRAKHRAKAGIQYNILKNLMFIADYRYQGKQVERSAEAIHDDLEWDDPDQEYEYYETPIDAYQLVDIALSYKFIDKMFGLNNASFKIFVNNLLNEEYETARGYPQTDRTYGCSLSVKI